VHAPASLREPLDRADVVITAAGQTAIEAAATGTPAIVTALVDNQRANARTLTRLGTAAPLDPDAPAGAVGRLLDELADPAVRGQMSRAAQSAVDGRGALRVAEAVARVATG
jgi:spore coat polysaccharide biosynthesis predicted glycosyltransferase SpsG